MYNTDVLYFLCFFIPSFKTMSCATCKHKLGGKNRLFFLVEYPSPLIFLLYTFYILTNLFFPLPENPYYL